MLAIIGPSTSGETMAVKNLAEEKKTLLISCAAAEAIVQPVAKYVFKTPQKDRFAALKIFEQMKKMNVTKIGVLSSNTGFGKAGKGLHREARAREWLPDRGERGLRQGRHRPDRRGHQDQGRPAPRRL